MSGRSESLSGENRSPTIIAEQQRKVGDLQGRNFCTPKTMGGGLLTLAAAIAVVFAFVLASGAFGGGHNTFIGVGLLVGGVGSGAFGIYLLLSGKKEPPFTEIGDVAKASNYDTDKDPVVGTGIKLNPGHLGDWTK